MNSQITGDLTGAEIYSTVYPASLDQNIAPGVQDILRKINSTLQVSRTRCFILQGYSQGAAVVLNALPKITGAAFAAVKGVVLVGNPNRKRGLVCNVDNYGGNSTRDVDGLTVGTGVWVPQEWVRKTLDVCIYVSVFYSRDRGIAFSFKNDSLMFEV
jgi:hypothetical protein